MPGEACMCLGELNPERCDLLALGAFRLPYARSLPLEPRSAGGLFCCELCNVRHILTSGETCLGISKFGPQTFALLYLS